MRRFLAIAVVLTTVGVWGAILRPAPLASAAETPFQVLQAEDDFVCQVRPLSAPKGVDGRQVAWSMDRTEFSCAFRGTRCEFWANSIGGHQEYLIGPSSDQAAVVAALAKLLGWPSDLPAKIEEQNSGISGVAKWHYRWSGYLLIEIADPARVT